MKLYRVMERIDEEGGGMAETKFVAERFRWFAFLVPVIWLLFQRLWLTALMVFLLVFAIGFVLPYFGFHNAFSVFCSLAVGLIIGLESTGLAVSSLEKRGWAEVGIANGETIDEAELRWFGRRMTEANPAEYQVTVGDAA